MTSHLDLLNRRAFFQRSSLGVGAFALQSLMSEAKAAPANPLAAHAARFAPKATRISYLHMIGAPSQLDRFDPKPELVKRDGEVCPDSLLKGKRFAFIGGQLKLSGSRFKFGQHGQSGQTFSELLPHMAGVADEGTVVRSLHTEEINHAPAQMFLHTGFGRGGRPSLGAWVTYGLGSDNADVPAYVVLLSGPPGGAGTSQWTNGILPGVYQGDQIRS